AAEAIYYAQSNGIPLHAAEEEVIGFSHPLVGGLLLRAWKFPDALVSSVACHHKPGSCKGSLEPAILHVADAVAVAMGQAPPASSVAPILDPAAWDRLGLPAERLGELVEEGYAQVDAIVSAFFPVRKN
ncbi:MAG: HDOD domain-containing protein, partial [Acidobacteriota bacterium]